MASQMAEICSSSPGSPGMAAVVISALVAILVVFLTQWFLSRRARKELLIKKIEELFFASNEYISSCRELLESLHDRSNRTKHGYYDYPSELINRFNESISKMQMICGLYFRKEKFDPSEFYVWRMPIFEVEHKGKQLAEGEEYCLLEDSKMHVRSSRERLDKLCIRLMEKYGR